MIEHHIQKDILNTLVGVTSARFSDLKPAHIEGNVFTYHLQQLIKQDYITKQADGSYCLTAQGKAAGITNKLTDAAFLQQAHSVLLLACRDDTGCWLLRRRSVHPMHNKIGFIHAEPEANEPICVTAARVFLQKSGLTAAFSPIGGGFIRIFKDDMLESFIHFTLLTAEAVSGDLREKDASGENDWYETPDFRDASFIPSMDDLVQYALEGKMFFAELEYRV